MYYFVQKCLKSFIFGKTVLDCNAAHDTQVAYSNTSLSVCMCLWHSLILRLIIGTSSWLLVRLTVWRHLGVETSVMSVLVILFRSSYFLFNYLLLHYCYGCIILLLNILCIEFQDSIGRFKIFLKKKEGLNRNENH